MAKLELIQIHFIEQVAGYFPIHGSSVSNGDNNLHAGPSNFIPFLLSSLEFDHL